MTADGLKPNVPIYTRLINFYTQVDRNRALELIEQMRGSNLQMDLAAHNTVVKFFARSGDVEKVAGWLKVSEISMKIRRFVGDL